jgi:hypothetical protein
MDTETGWYTKSLSVDRAGWYWIGFAMAEAAEGSNPSAIALGNVRYQTFASPVPEPETYGMWLVGLGVLAVAGRRDRPLRISSTPERLRASVGSCES